MEPVAWLNQVAELLGKIVLLGGGPVLVAYAAVRFFAKSWLKHELDVRLAAFQAKQAEQLEGVKARNAEQLEGARHRLDKLFRQTSKLHEKEFAVLEDAWQKLNEAMGHAAQLVSSFQQSLALDRMEQDRFEAFVAESRLTKIDQAELLRKRKGERDAYYDERIFWYRLRDAKKASTELHRAVQGNSIFLEPGIRALFLKIDGLLWEALISREIGHEVKDHNMWIKAGEKVTKEIAPLKAEIEDMVQKRIGYGVDE